MFGTTKRRYYTRYRSGGTRKGAGYSRGTAVGRARSSGLSARKGTKTENLNVTVQGFFNFIYGITAPPMSNVIMFHPYMGGVDPTTGTVRDAYINVHGGAVNDRQFRLKCAQYDEVRLDSMKVYINPVVSGTSAATPAMTIASIWDRKAGPAELGIDIAGSVIGRVPSAKEVFNNEGSIKTVTNMNSTRGISRSCYATNMQEKTYFWDSTIAKNSTQDESPLLSLALDAWEKKDGGFSPALYLVSQLNMTSVFGTVYTCSYRVEYNFTFRNPKSELDDFITLEDPTYTNPMGGRNIGNRTTAYIMKYQEEARKAEELQRGSYKLDLPATAAATKKEEKPEEKDETKQEETQPMEIL